MSTHMCFCGEKKNAVFNLITAHTIISAQSSYFLLFRLQPMYIYLITKTRLYNSDPLQPHFYIVKLGFTGVYIIFLISAQKHRLWVFIRTASASGSNEYPQSIF